MKQILRLSIAGIALFAVACTDTVQPGMQQLATRRVASGHSTATEDPCTDCILGSVIGPVADPRHGCSRHRRSSSLATRRRATSSTSATTAVAASREA